MGNYRHSTDRVDGQIIAECHDCKEYSVTVEYSAAEESSLEILKQIVLDECPGCGGEVGFLEHETPTEILD